MKFDIRFVPNADADLDYYEAREDYLLEPADEFDREVAALGGSERFLSFLQARSNEAGDIPINEVRQKRGM